MPSHPTTTAAARAPPAGRWQMQATKPASAMEAALRQYVSQSGDSRGSRYNALARYYRDFLLAAKVVGAEKQTRSSSRRQVDLRTAQELALEKSEISSTETVDAPNDQCNAYAGLQRRVQFSALVTERYMFARNLDKQVTVKTNDGPDPSLTLAETMVGAAFETNKKICRVPRWLIICMGADTLRISGHAARERLQLLADKLGQALMVGDEVECRNSDSGSWSQGIVTTVEPLRISFEWDTSAHGGCSWKQVRKVKDVGIGDYKLGVRNLPTLKTLLKSLGEAMDIVDALEPDELSRELSRFEEEMQKEEQEAKKQKEAETRAKEQTMALAEVEDEQSVLKKAEAMIHSEPAKDSAIASCAADASKHAISSAWRQVQQVASLTICGGTLPVFLSGTWIPTVATALHFPVWKHVNDSGSTCYLFFDGRCGFVFDDEVNLASREMYAALDGPSVSAGEIPIGTVDTVQDGLIFIKPSFRAPLQESAVIAIGGVDQVATLKLGNCEQPEDELTGNVKPRFQASECQVVGG
eukprot:SAG31_NODE_1257_length_9081_cov_7.585838_3_plen_527_part_00